MKARPALRQPKDASPVQDWRTSMPVDSTSIVRQGMRWVGLTLALFTVWGLFFPLASSVVSMGTVTPTGQAKVIQHPAGGVVVDILAHDGDHLEKGALIARIEPAIAKAELTNLLARRSLLEAQESRLRSMKSGSTDFQRPNSEQLLQLRGTQNSPLKVSLNLSESLGDVMLEQEAEFMASRDRLSKELSALEQQLEGFQRERDSLKERAKQQARRITMTRDQIARMSPLAKSGYIAKVRLWDAQAQLAELEGNASQLEGEIASRQANIAEVKDRISVLRSTSREEISKERSAILTELAGINQQIRAAELAVEYSEMKAPTSGTLAKLQVSTIGGVIAPGETIAEIIPDSAKPVIETRIPPKDIGEIQVGHEAELIVTSFNRRLSDPIVGRVSYVAANSSLDERTGENYFVVRVEPEVPNKPGPSANRLISGMQADVYIRTGSRSFFSWMLAPVFDSMRRAFNEA